MSSVASRKAARIYERAAPASSASGSETRAGMPASGPSWPRRSAQGVVNDD
ncbi:MULTISPECIES: hypothetical protein [unclassified Haloarcula]|uniref:hypothetical protein n=1 Tax=unclassified Haloarcula TaxID=2624677 RepID=UPI001783E354|nr:MULTISPECIES: hypothetical protein [unclassified Haloarcula]